MENFSEHIVAYGVWTVVVIVFIFLLRAANIIRYIPNNQVGIVEKLWATRGSIKSGFIALHGEAGFQPEILRGGIHFFFPFTYRIHKSDLVTVGQGKIAYVFARDVAPLAQSQVHAGNDIPERAEFQDVRQFLLNGGQKGPQRKILREGTYAINTTQFAIITDERVYGHALSALFLRVLDGMRQTLVERDGFGSVVIAAADDNVGIVTVHDGPSLPPGEIIAPEVGTDLANSETFPQQFPGAGKVLASGWLSRPAASGAGRRHLVHQPAVRHSRMGAQDRHSRGQCRCRDPLYRSQDPRRVGRRISSRRTRGERLARPHDLTSLSSQFRYSRHALAGGQDL